MPQPPLAFDVAMCTFRRPQASETLAALAKLTPPPGARVRILVIDNDDTPSARSLTEAAAAVSPFPIRYIHAPARNISIARNAALAAAEGDFLAFVDDDETVSPGWLTALFARAEGERGDVVFGPVVAAYPREAPRWIVEGDYHSVRPVLVNGRIETGYSGNALIRRGRPWDAERFLEALGRSGGEDTEFFDRLVRAGATLLYAPLAEAREGVPASRLTFRWLWMRRLRYGQTHARVLKARAKAGLGGAALAFGKALICLGGAAATVWRPSAMRGWLLRGALHVGVIAGLCGGKDLELY